MRRRAEGGGGGGGGGDQMEEEKGAGEANDMLVETSDAEKEEEERVVLGSDAYYKGFLESPLQKQDNKTRGDGTEQAIKMAASSALVLALLTAAFMMSNGLL